MNIEQKANAYLAGQNNINEVHATADGFLFNRKDNAKAHALTLNDKEVATFKKAGAAPKKSVSLLDGSIKDVQERLKDITEIEVIDAFIVQEMDGSNRKGAIEALEDRKAELTKTA